MSLWPAFLTLSLFICITRVSAAEDQRPVRIYDKDHPADFKPEFPTAKEWEQRAQFLRNQALVSQGLWPMPEKTPLNPVIHGRIERDTYTIDKVFLASRPGHYVSGNLYIPKNRSGKLPVVLCPFGHWPGGRLLWNDDAKVAGEIAAGAEKAPNAARSPLQANSATLARMGCIVFQYDMVGYADSQKISHRSGFLDAEAVLRLQSFMGLQTWNSIRALDFLLSLPNADLTRVGIAGSSGGGTQTIAVCAVDSRITCAFPMVMVSMNMQGGCVCENAPLYRVFTNNVELACLHAPNPEGMACANDWTKDFLTRGLPEMKSIWKLYGAEDLVEGEHFNFPHNHNLHSRLMQYEFLNKHLKLGIPTPIIEPAFDLVPPNELSVYNDQHPLPADALNAHDLRAQMTLASDTQLAALSSRTRDYESTLRVALEAMVVDQMPVPSDVTAEPEIQPASDWEGTISRNGAAEHVECKLQMPANWNGVVVIWARPAGTAFPHGKATEDAAVLVMDWPSDSKPQPEPVDESHYVGFTLGYRRTILAERIHNLLSAIALARRIPGVKSVRVVGTGLAGPSALLAASLAGDSVDRAAIDLNHFDFDQVHDVSDEMILPGALKYGGIKAFARLYSPEKLRMLVDPSSDQLFHSALR